LDLSIVVVNWNTKELLLDCLASVFATVTGVQFEVWLVDNGSTDGSVAAVRERFAGVHVIENRKNLGFAAANNQAFRRMAGRYALLLNTDAVLTDGAVSGLYGFMETHPDFGMACGQLLNSDGSKQNSIANFPTILTLLCNETLLGVLFPSKFPSKRRDYEKAIDVESCIGAALMVRKKAIDDVGLLDEAFFFFFEETDWARRMKEVGWRVGFVPPARVYHLQGQSVGHKAASRRLFYRSRYVYLKKWHRQAYPLLFVVIVVRLLVNAVFNFLGFVITLGLHTGIRNKLTVYSSLVVWHLRGCPEMKQ
jgi:GT2 family glycosyltransferase